MNGKTMKVLVAALLAAATLWTAVGCTKPEEPANSSGAVSALESGPADEQSSAAVSSGAVSSGEAYDDTLEEEVLPPMKDLPTSGELKLMKDGYEYIPAEFNRRNGCYRDGYMAFFIDGADDDTGLHIDGTTVLTYTVKNKAGQTVQESSEPMNTEAFPELQGKNGYHGIAMRLDEAVCDFKKFDKLYFTVSFTDLDGNEFQLNNVEFFYGLSYLGVLMSDYDMSSVGVKTLTSCTKTKIITKGKVHGNLFTLTLELNLWERNTKPDQLVNCVKVFWYCYPKYYERFGKDVGSPTEITLRVENEGYEIASAGGNEVHIHDGWLKGNKTDYDCLTHEFAHITQNGWDGNYCQYSGFIERFADYCRYVYALNDGFFNDQHWAMQTARSESTVETSVRFLAYLDFTYSTKDNDIVKNYFMACYSKKYPASKWDAAWEEILRGSKAEGKTVNQLFAEFVNSEFANLSTQSKRRGGSNPLNDKYDVRRVLRERDFA